MIRKATISRAKTGTLLMFRNNYIKPNYKNLKGIYIYVCLYVYRVFQEECAIFR
jgi:hypothetical protein